MNVDGCFPQYLCLLGDTTRVLTGSADNTAKLWDCETGKEVSNFVTGSAVRTCGFSHNGNYLMYSTDAALGFDCEIFLYDIRVTDSPIGYVKDLMFGFGGNQ